MAAPVPLRSDYDAAALRRLARSSHDPGQVRRLLALAAIYEGEPRSVAAGSACRRCATGSCASMMWGRRPY